MKLAALAPLFQLDADWVCLQKEVSIADAALLEAKGVIVVGPELTDFDDTAALVAELDLVISVDTSLAHLAGALGKPVWVMLPFDPDWRWLLDREDSPWYASARLFRQDRPGDFASVVERIRDRLMDEGVTT